MTLRSFGLNRDIFGAAVGLPPVNGATLVVSNNYYAPAITLRTDAGTVWQSWISPTVTFTGVNAGAASDIAVTALRGADAGDILATWHRGPVGMPQTLVGEVFDANGQALTAVFPLSSQADPVQLGGVVALPAGGFMAVFADGSHAGAPVQVAPGTTAAEGLDLAGRLFDSAFNPLGGDFAIQQPGGSLAGDQGQPSTVLLANGSVAAAYSDAHFAGLAADGGAGLVTQLRVALLSAAGAPLGNLLVDSADAASGHALPAAQPVAFLTGRGFGVLWQATDSVGGDAVHALNLQLFDSAGHAIGGAARLRADLASVNPEAAGGDYGVAATVLSNGRVVVAYSVALAGGRQVFLQEYGAGGTRVGDAVQASSGPGDHALGALYAAGPGRAVVGVIGPDGHQTLMEFSEAPQATRVTFGDGSYSVTTQGIAGHDWTTSVGQYTSQGLLFQETWTDATGHLWQSYALSGGVGTTRTFDAAGTLVQQVILQADGSREVDRFGITGKGYDTTETFYDATGFRVALDQLGGGTLLSHQVFHQDGSKEIYAYAVTGKAWTHSASYYGTDGRLDTAEYRDDAGVLRQQVVLADDGTRTTSVFDAAGLVLTSTILAADGSREVDAHFATGAYWQSRSHYAADGTLLWRGYDNNDATTTTRLYADHLGLTAAAGNELFVLAGQDETLVFKPGFGHDIVQGFTAIGAGHDHLVFGAGLFGSAAAVLAHAHAQGRDVMLVADADDGILLKGITLAQLAVADLVFG